MQTFTRYDTISHPPLTHPTPTTPPKTDTHSLPLSLTHIHPLSLTRAPTHTHIHTHTHTHLHTHTHTHTLITAHFSIMSKIKEHLHTNARHIIYFQHGYRKKTTHNNHI